MTHKLAHAPRMTQTPMQIPLPQTTFAIAVPLATGATFSPVGNAWGQQETHQIPRETAQQLRRFPALGLPGLERAVSSPAHHRGQ